MTALQYLHHIDQDITLVVNSWNSPFTDWLWQLCSDRLVWAPLYALVLFFFFRRLGWKRAVVATVACILTIVACDQLGNLVKNAVQRLRPCWDMNMVDRGLRVLEGKGGKFGFYSAHAANAAGFAICSCRMFRAHDKLHRYRVYGSLMTLWALMVGLSRVFVGKHFLGDVCTGFVVGLILGYAIAELAKVLLNRFNL